MLKIKGMLMTYRSHCFMRTYYVYDDLCHAMSWQRCQRSTTDLFFHLTPKIAKTFSYNN